MGFCPDGCLNTVVPCELEMQTTVHIVWIEQEARSSTKTWKKETRHAFSSFVSYDTRTSLLRGKDKMFIPNKTEE